MYNTRKHLFFFVLLIISTIILVGCATQPPEQAQDTTVLQTEEIELQPTSEETAAPTEEQAPTETEVEEALTAGVSFSTDVLPIMESRCVNCHGGERVYDGIDLSTYKEIMAVSQNGPIVIPGNPEESLLVEVVVTEEMPKRGPKLTPVQVQIISDWVAAGAPNN